MKQKMRRRFILWGIFCSLFLGSCSLYPANDFSGTSSVQVQEETSAYASPQEAEDLQTDGEEPYQILNENQPEFSEEQKKSKKAFEIYSPLDSLGRCGVAFANICKELMPTGKRGEIGMVKPSGWRITKYNWIDGKYLYNRCHLIGYQLAGENANERNLITGTRYLNVEGMLPFENEIADYVKKTGHHVLYRVTPVFEGKNLLASGVQMEAYSVEDHGKGVCFNVYAYNIQPGVIINYANGKSKLGTKKAAGDTGDKKKKDETAKKEEQASGKKIYHYILNKNTKKFHYSYCSGVKEIQEENRGEYRGDREKLVNAGYSPCGKCNP